jgi:hypothetical protein
MPLRRATLVAIAVLVGFTAGCGGEGDSDSAAPGGAAVEAGGGQQAGDDQVAADRKVVYTAELTLHVDSVGPAATQAVDEANKAGGFLFAEKADDSSGTQLTLKVPNDRFEPFLATLAGLGDVTERNVDARDVTAEVVDLEGRLKSATASADRLRALLGSAASTGEIVSIEAELAKREADVESLQGRLRVVTDQVDLATVTIRVTEDDDLAVSDDLPGFLSGLRAGWVVLVNAVLVVVAVVGFLLPFLPFLALAAWLIRRYRRRHPKPQWSHPPNWPSPGPTAPPSPPDSEPVSAGAEPSPPP